MTRDIRIGLTWHAVAARNLGVGALTLGNIALARQAATRAGLRPRFMVISPRETAPPYVSGEDIDLRTISGRYIGSPGGYLSDLGRLDIVLDIGAGDSFTDTYGDKRFAYIMATKMLPIARGVPLVLSPQTIGPFSRQPHMRAAAWACGRAAAVFARDPLSSQALRSLAPGARAFETIDVAFALPFERPARKDGPLRVGVNVSGLLFNGGYTGKGEFGMAVDYASYTNGLLAALVGRKDVAVELICHVSAPEQPRDDDGAVAERLAADVPGVRRVPDFASPSEAKSFISGLDFLVGARMHATIAAYSTGVPVVPVSYSRKFEGLFGGLDYRWVVPRTGMSTEAALAFTLDALERRGELEAAIQAGRPIVARGLETYVTELARLFAAAAGS